ncbi:MAG TPA: hypothetical protein VGE51_09740 [Fontimonas sp.]
MKRLEIRHGELPADALLRRHARGYTDCYWVDVPRQVPFADYVEAFCTAGVFRIERRLLAWFVARPSTDAQARELALGTRDAFAAWTVEARLADQLLMADFSGRTRLWLMSAPDPARQATRLFLGSAVMPMVAGRSGAASMGFTFRALLGFHRLYSRILLRTAAERALRNM